MIKAEIIADSSVYGFIYLTSNKINNKIYIGKRVLTRDYRDLSYLGSGKILKQAIKKYGKNNFERVILHFCLNENDLLNKELSYISEYDCMYPNGYNIAQVNCGGDVMKNHPNKEIINKKRLEQIRNFVRDSA